MIRKKILVTVFAALASLPMSAQIQLTPVFDATIGGLNENNTTIVEGRLRSMISSLGMESGYGGRFVLACKVAALQREVSGTKMIQNLEVTFAIGDNMANVCFGMTGTEVMGIGNTEGQAMTSALKNIKPTPKLKALVAEAKVKIIDYYEQNGAGIIRQAQNLVTAHQWEEALWMLSAIPQECSHYKRALRIMNDVYVANINHDAKMVLNEAQAVWSSDPNPGPAADEAMRILSQIDPSSSCYPQAQALMRKIESRVKNVTDKRYNDAVAMEKARMNAAVAVEKARVRACRDVAVAYAKSQPRVIVRNNYYHNWW